MFVYFAQDLHRTGCSSYCGQEGEQDRVVLKRVLLAYARWNKAVGYCQGFNVLAALILEVTEGSESDALKVGTHTHANTQTETNMHTHKITTSLLFALQVMIYLIDKVLPESYFANNLRALSGKTQRHAHFLNTECSLLPVMVGCMMVILTNLGGC